MKNLKDYPGSKFGSGVYQNIINIFPKHDIYIEPFLGAGAILKNKDASSCSIGIDINRSIIANYSDTGENFFSAGDSLIFLDAAAILLNALLKIGLKILIYCDPPYLLSSRRSGRKYYFNEWNEADHIRFLSLVRILKCYVVISAYPNKLYADKLINWNYKEFQTITHKSTVIEAIYYNFPSNLEKHQYNFLGNNFRERAAIKGRVFRNLSKINKMPPDEQNYLFQLLRSQISSNL